MLPQDSQIVNFRMHEYSVRFICNDLKIYELVKHFFYPFCITENNTDFNVTVIYYCAPNIDFFEVRKYIGNDNIGLFNEDDFLKYVLNKENNTVYILSNKKVDVIYVARIVRAVFRFLFVKDNWVLFHASAYADDDGGHLIIGNKFDGKTYTLLQKLKTTSNAQFISNDKVFLKRVGDDVLITALPHKAGIRFGTIKDFTEILQWLSCHKTTYKHMQFHEIENYLNCSWIKNIDEYRILLTPLEISDIFHVGIKSQTKMVNIQYAKKVVKKEGILQRQHISIDDDNQRFLDKLFIINREKEKNNLNNLLSYLSTRGFLIV